MLLALGCWLALHGLAVLAGCYCHSCLVPVLVIVWLELGALEGPDQKDYHYYYYYYYYHYDYFFFAAELPECPPEIKAAARVPTKEEDG